MRPTSAEPASEGSRAAQPSTTAQRDTGSSEDGETEPVPTPAEFDEPRPDATLTIPSIDVHVVVVSYLGRTDDLPGSEIQNGGLAASPYGPRGGVGPGEIGNYQVTAHRTSSARPFNLLPDLKRGQRVFVDVGDVRYVYRVTSTRETSFRSPASLRAQRAPVPGQPGVAPTDAMITLSTCATPEDYADGNHWHDEFGNPEHRIDKIGRLVAVRSSPS
jgi:sortase A